MLGGLVGIHLDPDPAAATEVTAQRDVDRMLDRMEAWAGRLTRFSRVPTWSA